MSRTNESQQPDASLDAEKLLVEVSAQFQSEEILKEVNWRLDVLREISTRPELAGAAVGLRQRLTRIFSEGGSETEVLGRLKEITEVEGADGEAMELARFLTRPRRTLDEDAYRQFLLKKIENTETMMVNLTVFFPTSHRELSVLSEALQELLGKARNRGFSAAKIKKQEERLRKSNNFESYEQLKTRFLGEWLEIFPEMTAEQIKGLSPEEIQVLVIEHQRHQMTQLLKTEIALSEEDVGDRFGLHDTLECSFSNEEFWQGCRSRAREGFQQWILAVVQSFGMLKGKRYAFFQSKQDADQALLFGMGVAELPEKKGDPLVMVPYVKPFTRKGGFLLEIRQLEISDPEQYHHELRHYVLPFLFGFDQIPNFGVNKELIEFFTSNY